MSEDVKETKKKDTTKKATTRKKKMESIQENNRFLDVIEKMEEETKKVQKNEKIEKDENVSVKKKTGEKVPKVKNNKKDSGKKSENKTSKTVKEKNKNAKIKEKKTEKETRIIKKTQVETELETIEKEIKNNTTTFKEEMTKIYKNIFTNIMFANCILIYFILIIMGYKSINASIFLTDMKVFSITLIIATICVFEKAYKKDSGKNAINGIELMFLAISTLLCLKLYMHYNSKFISAVTSIALLFAIYYVGKSIVIYIKQKKEANKLKNDIRKIAKK